MLSAISILAYQSSDIFKQRVDEVIIETIEYKEVGNVNTSIGTRLSFFENTLEIIKDNLLFGVGTGGFPKAYVAYSQLNSPDGYKSTNPHNMFLLAMSQFGLIGLLSLLSIYYYQFICRTRDGSYLSNLGLGLMTFFLVINFSDSYLLGHFTSFQFVFLSAFLFLSEKN